MNNKFCACVGPANCSDEDCQLVKDYKKNSSGLNFPFVDNRYKVTETDIYKKYNLSIQSKEKIK